MAKDDTIDEDMLIEDDEESTEDKYLMCKLGQEVYGINISHVTDIIELQKITEVPDMPEYVKGVINLRGQVIPIIDLRLRFRMEGREYDDRTVITVVNIHGASIGFIVDTATEVQAIPEKAIDPAPSFHGGADRKKYIAGLGKIGEQVIIILDMERLVQAEEVESLQEAAK
ncbi:MAG TPA: purine-binding chemotaxis protein CheW [Sediminispirochaeta sp.]|nr:purine-binding chemotaxis protein CheW [Sediminispirochaeta sp.]